MPSEANNQTSTKITAYDYLYCHLFVLERDIINQKIQKTHNEHSDLDGKQREVTVNTVKKLKASSWLLPTFVTEGKREEEEEERRRIKKKKTAHKEYTSQVGVL